MSLIIRIDVDRPYGRHPVLRHVLSRVSSDLYLPKVPGLGFLAELQTMLTWLNDASARAYVFFRRCTLPYGSTLELLDAGHHEIGLHLENSRSFNTFLEETQIVERHFGKKVLAVSKHGSGGEKFGFHHYAPYEPERYVEWAQQASMRLFLGNLQDPSLVPTKTDNAPLVFPSAFWLEPLWRDTKTFTVDWLLDHARHRDIVLLVHPENVLADSGLVSDFKRLIRTLESKTFQ
jgi:hypothetical protein